jgi:hypothetical protein
VLGISGDLAIYLNWRPSLLAWGGLVIFAYSVWLLFLEGRRIIIDEQNRRTNAVHSNSPITLAADFCIDPSAIGTLSDLRWSPSSDPLGAVAFPNLLDGVPLNSFLNRYYCFM